ncbi:hypothetical protein Hanom_Chr09g00779261 [Helianthus anomalus]
METISAFLPTMYHKNKGGYDQLNKTQTFGLVALVNEWDYNFSAFIFDNLKKMLEDPKKKIFMLYPRFIQMILDEKHPELVKVLNYINLKTMGTCCFENAYRVKRAKQHNFINVQVAEEHDVQQVQQVAVNEAEVETKILDSDSETDSSEEETDTESKVEIVASDKEEETVRQPGGDGNPPTVRTSFVQNQAAVTSEIQAETEAITDDAEQAASKRQRTDTAPDHDLSDPFSNSKPTTSIDPQPDPQYDAASKKNNIEEPDLYNSNFDFQSTPS